MKKKSKILVKHKKLLKKTQASVTMKPFQAPSILGDKNRFFQSQILKDNLGGDFE